MIDKSNTSFKPDYISIPGETLQDILDSINMKQAELAKRTGRPLKTINEIIKGTTGITPETALQFEKVLGTPAHFWNNREKKYRELLSKKNEQEQLADNIEWLQKFPLREMINYKWINKCENKIDQLIEVLKFYGIAAPNQWNSLWNKSQIAFRKSPVFKSNPYAVSAWLRQGEKEAQNINCNPFNKNTFKEALNKIAKFTVQNNPGDFIPQLIELCANSGVAVVFLREIKKIRLSGSARWISQSKALIQLSIRYLSNDHLWFSFFHEAGHILFNKKKMITLENININSKTKDRDENKINKFARDFLIPKNKYREFIKNENITLHRIKEFAQNIKIAPGIVVGRLQHDKIIPYSKFNELKIRYKWTDDE